MAHSVIHTGHAGRTYNVDAPVGRSWRSKNMRDDTMLVQALLRIFYYELYGQTDRGINFEPPTGSSSAGDLTVDGICGPVTQSHIDSFLDQLVRFGPSEGPSEGRLNDHAIDPVRVVGDSKHIFLSGLSELNYFCFWNDSGMRSVPLEGRASDPEVVPPYLASALTRVKTHR